ncbi:hypothetical protein ABH931_005648 [Streptacidiphilus sp. MAP12-33]|uniref:hypothetical protein n=1 Tax=Streptacidiphilus sp. MAP12-33 TaxID=3156266 RepID=UPI003517DEF0
MSTPWRAAATEFERVLARHGVSGADAVDCMDVAWAAFGEFVQVPIEGLVPVEDDGDGFIVEWGCWDWNEGRPAISLGRQLVVVDRGHDGAEGDPEYWKVELQVGFAADQPWSDLAGVAFRGTGFDFVGIGPLRVAALAGARVWVESFPELREMWQARPVSSGLRFGRAD